MERFPSKAVELQPKNVTYLGDQISALAVVGDFEAAEKVIPRLERLDPKTTHGVRCRSCGFEDEAQSSWLLAEEEGPLEDIVLESRRRDRGPSKTPVDSLRSRD